MGRSVPVSSSREITGEKEDGVGYVGLAHHTPERRFLGESPQRIVDRGSAAKGPRLNSRKERFRRYRTGANRVDADAVTAEIERRCTDNTEYCVLSRRVQALTRMGAP